MFKKIFCKDRVNLRDNHSKKPGVAFTDICIVDPITGKVLQRTHNRVVLGGSLFTASKFFDIEPPTNQAYDSISELAIVNSSGTKGQYQKPTDPSKLKELRNSEKVCLFAVGVGGCSAADTGSIITPEYAARIEPDNLVPFRTVSAGTVDISGISKYHGVGTRRLGQNQKKDYDCYYFKEFDNDPIISVRDIASANSAISDSDLIGIYSNADTKNIDVMVELNFKITKEECREFANAKEDGKITTTILSAFSLISCYKTLKPGSLTEYNYENFQPITLFNIAGENMTDPTKGLDIIYHIYF